MPISAAVGLFAPAHFFIGYDFSEMNVPTTDEKMGVRCYPSRKKLVNFASQQFLVKKIPSTPNCVIRKGKINQFYSFLNSPKML
jgi:hypothetical protein